MVPYTLSYSMIWGLLLGLWVVVAGSWGPAVQCLTSR
jgi:hypothetical protein